MGGLFFWPASIQQSISVDWSNGHEATCVRLKNSVRKRNSHFKAPLLLCIFDNTA
jgi:hypothetical protein